MALLYDKYKRQLKELPVDPLSIKVESLRKYCKRLLNHGKNLPKEAIDELNSIRNETRDSLKKYQASWNNLFSLLHTIEDAVTESYSGKTEVIIADNVAEYFFQQKENYSVIDFPNIAPCFPSMWIEFARPQRIDWENNLSRWAIWMIGDKVPEDIDWASSSAYDYVKDNFKDKLDEKPKWLVNCLLYVKYKDQDICFGPGGVWNLALNDLGEIIAQDFRELVKNINDISGTKTKLPLKDLFYAALLTISLMHCKNVEVIEKQQSEAQSKQWKKETSNSLTKYKVLSIEPMKKVLKSVSNHSTGIKQALHICRGHFRDYREHGLFGKHKGIYWWDAFVRGAIQKGEIVKDYEVKVS